MYILYKPGTNIRNNPNIRSNGGSGELVAVQVGVMVAQEE
jgi:hypothetical protein